MSFSYYHKDRFEQYSLLLSTLIGIECRIDLIPCAAGSATHLLPLYEQLDNKNRPDASELCWDRVDDKVDLLVFKETCLLFRTCVHLGSDEKEFWLSFLVVEKSNSQITRTIPQLTKMLHLIARFVCDDYNNNLMLDGMAHELAIRYEELNVFYGLDELNSGDEDDRQNEESALLNLIENCLDYLSVDLAAIIVPAENITIFKPEDHSEIAESNTLLEKFSTEILQSIKESGETLVINQDEVTDWTEEYSKIPVKFIASPILDIKDEVYGILVFSNAMDKLNFTNSDRKLCDVFAIEVSNLLKRKRDRLTALLNRRGFEAIGSDVSNKLESGEANYCVVHIDLDQFKIINDTSGYETGDRLLQQFSAALRTLLAENTILARTNADEFSILLENCGLNEAEKICNSLHEKINEMQFFSKDKVFNLKFSTGIAEAGKEIKNFSEVIKTAEMACSVAKKMGGNRFRVYDKSDKDVQKSLSIMAGANHIRTALERNKFVLYAQAIVPGSSDESQCNHYEVLIRMLDDKGGIVPPGLFIPAAEKYKLMRELDQWVVDKSITMLADFNASSGDNSLVLSINLSGESIGDDRFKTYVAKVISAGNVRPEQICFEVTETEAIENLSEALSFIEIMRGLGCSFALDDFGSGMSSFGYLKHLPIDYLKIDGGFVKNINEQNIDKAMVESINSIGHVMGLKTVAEFVENGEIQETLCNIGVDYLQGYGLHKPEPLESVFSQLLTADTAVQVAG
ncbi:MAG: EAL domain-containing protein [Gammaproteobacteria bacterium]|nr:EAL domain-containing protein [Gammaproteobacteria bacterium]